MWTQKPQASSLASPQAAQPSPASSAFASRDDVAQAAARARALLKKRALFGAAVSTIPIPGLDWAVDAALLSQLLPRINEEFGLTPEQLDQLSPTKREQVQKAVAMVGSVVIGKFITRDVVMRLARAAGMRMTTKQAAKYVPLAGTVAAAALGYATLRYLGERHIQDCLRVVEHANLDLPGRLRRTVHTVEQSSASARSWSQADRGPWGRNRQGDGKGQ